MSEVPCRARLPVPLPAPSAQETGTPAPLVPKDKVPRVRFPCRDLQVSGLASALPDSVRRR